MTAILRGKTQGDIIKLFSESNNGNAILSANEIAKNLNKSTPSIHSALKSLREFEVVKKVNLFKKQCYTLVEKGVVEKINGKSITSSDNGIAGDAKSGSIAKFKVSRETIEYEFLVNKIKTLPDEEKEVCYSDLCNVFFKLRVIDARIKTHELKRQLSLS